MMTEDGDPRASVKLGSETLTFTASKYPPQGGLEKSLWLPFGFVHTPLAKPETSTSTSSLLVCRTCLAHASIYSEINGKEWTCSLCNCKNTAGSEDQLKSLNCQTTVTRRRLPPEVADNLTTAETLVIVIDSNIPLHEARGIGKALEGILADSERVTPNVGLVVFDEYVSVYQLESPGNIAVADVFGSSKDITQSMLESRPYLINSNGSGSMQSVWQCLNAVYGADLDSSDQENIQANKPLSRLELLKKQKEERLRKKIVGSGDVEPNAKSPWVRAKESKRNQPAVRSTGEAVHIALDLVPDDSQGRILLFTNGCPNNGEASVIDKSNPRSLDPVRVTNSSNYLEVLARGASEEANIGIDVFLMGDGELAVPVFTSLCEPSSGYALIYDSFTSPCLTEDLRHVALQSHLTPVTVSRHETNSRVDVPDGCFVDIRTPNFLDTTHIIGPGDMIDESGLLPCEQDAFDKSSLLAKEKKGGSLPNKDFVSNTTTRIRMGRFDPLCTFSMMLQANEFHQKDPYAFFQFIVRYVEGDELITQVTSHRLHLAKDTGEFLDSVNEEAVAVVLGKEAVYRSMYGREMVASDEPPPTAAGDFLKTLASDSQRDLDATVRRISGCYRLLRLEKGNRGMDLTENGKVPLAGSSIDFAFPPELGEALMRLYYLRRNPLLSPDPTGSEDNRSLMRSMFLRLPLSDCLSSMAPAMWTTGQIDGQLGDAAQLETVRPESLALWENCIVAADFHHSLFVWSGRSVSDKGYDSIRQSLKNFLLQHSRNRFPTPAVHILYQGGSMERRFTPLLAPSHGDSEEHQMLNFPALSNLSTESLDRLRGGFSFYDQASDPSFREWFWNVAGTAKASTSETVVTLCE